MALSSAEHQQFNRIGSILSKADAERLLYVQATKQQSRSY